MAQQLMLLWKPWCSFSNIFPLSGGSCYGSGGKVLSLASRVSKTSSAFLSILCCGNPFSSYSSFILRLSVLIQVIIVVRILNFTLGTPVMTFVATIFADHGQCLFGAFNSFVPYPCHICRKAAHPKRVIRRDNQLDRGRRNRVSSCTL